MKSYRQLRVLTNSARRTYRSCARKFYFAYVLLCRTLNQPEALRFGTLVHLGLEAWWLCKQAPREVAPGVAALEAMRPHAKDEYELARAGVLLAGYDARWGEEAFEVIAVEAQLFAPLTDPESGEPSSVFEHGMKLDVLVRDLRDGRVKVIEHKTSAEDISAGSDYWKRLTLDSQISTYVAGAKASGYDVDECVYDVIGKPQLRPKEVPLTDDQGAKIVLDKNGERVRTARGKYRETADKEQGYELQTRPETPVEFMRRLTDHVAEDPDRYYQRKSIVRLEAEEIDAAYDAWHTAALILESERANRWPRNPDACLGKGRCDYFDVCTGTASLEDPARFRVAATAHEELQLEAEAAE